jgi:hypothetical protein
VHARGATRIEAARLLRPLSYSIPGKESVVNGLLREIFFENFSWSVPLLTTHPHRALIRWREFSVGLSKKAESPVFKLYATVKNLSTCILE